MRWGVAWSFLPDVAVKVCYEILYIDTGVSTTVHQLPHVKFRKKPQFCGFERPTELFLGVRKGKACFVKECYVSSKDGLLFRTYLRLKFILA